MQLEFWINAFIPKTVGGYTQTIKTGPHAGKTAVPLPMLARLAPGNSLKPMATGYLTDQRDFKNYSKASVRMQSRAVFDVANLSIIEEPQQKRHWTSGTTEVNIDTGEELGFKKANMKRCEFTPAGTSQRDGNTFMNYDLKAAASDPLVQAAADIDYVGRISFGVNHKTKQVEFYYTGKLDAFPAFEAYVANGSDVRTLFRRPPPMGNTVMNLVGKAKRPIEGHATFVFLSGV